MPKGGLKLFACRSGRRFGEMVAGELTANGCLTEGLSKYIFNGFECGENKQHGLEKSVREADVFVIQDCTLNGEIGTSVDDNTMELLRFINGLRESCAGKITAVIPMLPYSRQDKIWERGEPYTAKLFAQLLESAGANQVVTMDLHSDQIRGFYNIPMEPLHASYVLLDRLKQDFIGRLEDVVFCSTDAGAAALVGHYAKRVNGRVAFGNKVKHYGVGGKEVERVDIIGDVQGKIVIIGDDMIDTAGSIVKTAEGAIRGGATEVYAFCAHAVLSNPARERLLSAKEGGILRRIYLTDSVTHPDGFFPEQLVSGGFYKVVSVAPLFARVIQKLHKGEGVSEVYLD